MQKPRFIYSCALSAALFFNSIAQNPVAPALGPIINQSYFLEQQRSPTTNLQQLIEQAEAYYAPLRVSNGGVPTQQEKFFNKWAYFWKTRALFPGVQTGGDVNATIERITTTNSYYGCNSGPASSQWSQIGPFNSTRATMGIVTAVAFQPNNTNILYAGSNTAGLWKSIDAGNNWVNITDGLGIATLGINTICIDPINPNNILAGTGTRAFGSTIFAPQGFGIIRSTDGGASWTGTNAASFPGAYLQVEEIRRLPSNPNTVFAVSSKNILKSTDGGLTWVTNFTNPNPIKSFFEDIEINISNENFMYATTRVSGATSGAELFISTDGGNTWNNLTPAGTGVCGMIDVTPADPTTAYIIFDQSGSSTIKKIYKCSLGSAPAFLSSESLITSRGTGLDFYWNHEFEVSDQTTNTLYIGGLEIMKGTWNGTNHNWSLVSAYTPDSYTHADVRSLVQVTNLTGDMLLMGHDGGIAQTSTGATGGAGIAWQNKNGNGLAITQFYSFSKKTSKNDFIGGTQDNATYVKEGNIWNSFQIGGDGGWSEIDPYDDNIVFATSYDKIYKTSINGVYPIPLTYINNPQSSWVLGRKFMIDPSNHNKLWWGVKDLFSYDIPTNTWSTKHTGPDSVQEISAIAVAPSDGKTIYEARTWPTFGNPPINKFFRSNDGGLTWTDLSPNMFVYQWSYVTDIEVDPKDKNTLYASCAGYWPDGSNPSQGLLRVIKSVDGGNNWTDMSTGLPPFTVHCLAIQQGNTENGLFCGTDGGAYQFDFTNGTWNCFNNGIPSTVVTKLEVHNCEGKLYASTYGRGLWEANLPVPTQYNVQGTSILWDANTDRAFNTDVVVMPNTTLTIKGQVTFATGKRLIIMPKSRVILDGGKLTNRCGETWGGVEVVGTGNQPQAQSGTLFLYQGLIDIINNGTIEHANDAITTGLTDGNGNFNWSTFGGVIRCTNAKFLNNRRDVQFMSYINYTNKSYFRNCLFETNQFLRSGNLPDARVSMWEVKGVKFYGCDFKYNAGTAYPVNDRGYGIVSIDASYLVSNLCLTSNSTGCLTSKPSTFTNLTYGVDASTSNPLYTANINHTNFDNCDKDAARFTGLHYASFNDNNVDVSGINPQSSGLYLMSCKYYSVQNNNFTTTHAGKVGIYVNNSAIGAHEIYRNNFSNLIVALSPIYDNSGTTNYTDGLTMHCNSFNANAYDIALTGSTQNSIAYVQGATGGTPNGINLVRNQYGAACGNENKYYIQSSTKPVQHAANSDVNCLPTPQPSCSDINVNVLNSGISYNATTQCKDLINTGTTGGVKSTHLTARIAASKDDVSTIENNYNALVDGGNTQTLLNAINSNMSNGNLKNLLEQKSPYLSDAVLMAYFSKASIPNGHIKDIHDKNKPVSEDVWNILLNRNLPTGVLNNIEEQQASKSISAITDLKSQVIISKYNVQLAVSDLIRFYLNDTIIENPLDSVYYVMKTEGRETHAACDKIHFLIAKGELDHAEAMADSLKIAVPTTTNFCEFQKIIIELRRTSEKAFKLSGDPYLKDKVIIASNNCSSEICYAAQSLLKLVFNTEFYYDKPLPEEQYNNARRGAISNDESTEIAVDDLSAKLMAYPNPTNDNLNVIYHGSFTEVLTLELQNALGQIVYSTKISGESLHQINTSTLESNIYFLYLRGGNNVLESKKVVIIK